MNKRETIQEYINRGGTIKTVAPQKIEEEKHTIKPNQQAPMVDLGTGQLLYSEFKPKKARKKKVGPVKIKNVNMAHVPNSLLEKLKDRVKF